MEETTGTLAPYHSLFLLPGSSEVSSFAVLHTPTLMLCLATGPGKSQATTDGKPLKPWAIINPSSF
jgi:hypothetical protein